MPEKELTLDEVRSMAAEIGLTRLSEESLQMLLRATNAARARRTALSTEDLGPADEPSHVFTLEPRGGL